MNENLCATFDIETLDTAPTGIILSLGVCLFDLNKVNTFDELVSQGMEVFFDQQMQHDVGRTESQSTKNWWAQQGEAAKRCLTPERACDCKKLNVYTNQLYTALGVQPDRKQIRWFSRGAFDANFLENFCNDFNISPPYKYYCWRDSRSYLDALGIGVKNEKMKKPDTMIAHNAHHDAAFEALMLQTYANKGVPR